MHDMSIWPPLLYSWFLRRFYLLFKLDLSESGTSLLCPRRFFLLN